MKESTAQQVEAALQTAMAISSPDPANPVRIPYSILLLGGETIRCPVKHY